MGRKRYQRKHNYVVISKDEFAKRRVMRASVVCVSMCLHASVVYVPACFRASVVYVPVRLRPNVPKVCQILIFTCQRANKCAKVPQGVPMFARQRTKLAFFKHSSYEMLREIAIPYYYIKNSTLYFISQLCMSYVCICIFFCFALQLKMKI